MDKIREEKLKHFVNDPVLADAVYSVVLKCYLASGEGKDVQTLAAERIAINLLDDAWKELMRFKFSNNEPPPRSGNIGV